MHATVVRSLTSADDVIVLNINVFLIFVTLQLNNDNNVSLIDLYYVDR